MADPFDNESLHNENLEDDTEFGLHPCTIEGAYDEDDEQFIEVKLQNSPTMLARVMHSFPFFGRISPEWLDAYSKSLIGYVAFEKGYPDRPLLMAVSFKKGKTHDLEDAPRSVTVLSEFYKLQFNDANKKGYIEFPDDATFYLGKLDASEPMVLGDKNKTSLEDIMTAVDDLAGVVTDILTALVSTTVPQLPSGTSVLSSVGNFTASLPDVIKVQADLATIKSGLGDSLSEKNFLE
jgi:hypothetical protein